jgi:hypothetical protein
MDRWPEEAYREVGLIRLKHRDEYSDDEEADFEAMIGNQVEISQPEEVVKLAMRMHFDIGRVIQQFTAETGLEIKLTPITFTNLLETFREIHDARGKLYTQMKRKYEVALTKLSDTELKIADVQDEMEAKAPELVKS